MDSDSNILHGRDLVFLISEPWPSETWAGAYQPIDGKTVGQSSWVNPAKIRYSPTASVSGLGRGFGRLKLLRVKSLAEKSSKLKQASGKDYEPVVESVPLDMPDLSFSKLDLLGKQKEAEPNKRGISTTRVVGTKHLVCSSYADFRGWGRGYLSLHRKVSSNSDFHGRKSFEDLGCSDYMIESLRKQHFLCPSHIQVLSNCRSISKFGTPLLSMVATGGFRQNTQLESMEEGVDVLIATPGHFIFLVKEGFLELKDLRCVILDEVDILCNDEEFEAAFQRIINSSPIATQYLFGTVEIPPDCEVIMRPGIHRTSPHLKKFLIDCSGEEDSEKTPDTAFLNKKSAFIQLVEESPVTKMIVFCDKTETCRKVENALKRIDRNGADTRVLPFHAAVSQELWQANMKLLLLHLKMSPCFWFAPTGMSLRGLNFTGVDHVILFNFPRDPNMSATERGSGGKGKAFVSAVGKQVSLARRIMERNWKGHP
ncbi:hypothetical protein ACJRO7_011459 [Eucalyptus globulus]|uniref:DEAD-box RNA helicase Q domain-containing protein n=1 Tax=Eucalyptus globulus TaxID=34317 RepID=A0ABD3LKQ7_EUCGL